jgi:DNA-directed RNA polymerase specialized sigma24 family protein
VVANADSRLHEQQRRLLELLGAGLSVAEAAPQLGVSKRTAERRLTEARARLGAATIRRRSLDCAASRRLASMNA